MNTTDNTNQAPLGERITRDRLIAVTDAILPFAMTLLVLNVDIPRDHDFTKDGLFSFLVKIEHDLIIYAASFLLIATYWIEHQQIFDCVRYISRTLCWLNYAFLFFVTTLPFGTKLKGIYRHDAIVVVVFGAIHIMCWLNLIAIWRYLDWRRDLLKTPIKPKANYAMLNRLWAGPLVILVAMGFAFINVRLGTLLLLSVPLACIAAAYRNPLE